jgi:hypothetical protein
MATRMLWGEMPRWLRALAIDAEVYEDDGIAALVESARCGDGAALEACRLLMKR